MRIWKWQAKARLYLTVSRLLFAKLRYHFLCFKHFGWRAAAIFVLETPEHLRSIAFDLFTPPHGAIPPKASDLDSSQ
jgi:hypothetical protein